MRNNKLPKKLLADLNLLEKELLSAVRSGSAEGAIEAATKIQILFGADRRHPRLMRSKLWAYEVCLDAQRLEYAERGLIGITQLSGTRTRVHLEASSLLAVCYLRQKKIEEAKKLIRSVIGNINSIKSAKTRHAFQKRLIERLEEECIFVELVGAGGNEKLDVDEVHSKAVELLQRSNDDELLRLIGNSIPAAGGLLLKDVRDYSIKQLPAADRPLLPAPTKTAESKHIGKAAFAVLRRVAWKTLCKEDSPIFKLWSKKVPEVFNKGYFAAAIVSTMNDYRIGISLLASGVLALVMKYSAEEFCELSKPKGIMMSRGEDS